MIIPLIYGMIKFSVLFLYQRIFLGQLFRWYSGALSYLLLIWAISFSLTFAFQCGTHPSWWWTSKATNARCLDSAKTNLAFSVSDVATDLLVLVTPLPFIWHLHVSNGDKIGLTFIFGLGLL